MFDLEDSLEFDSNYFDVQNISFDHPLNSEEIENFRLTIFNINNLENIYFKGNVDIKSIEKIKNLLLMSGLVEDKNIEKFITSSNITNEELKTFLQSSFENPETWNIAYKRENNNFLIANIPSVRKLIIYIDDIKKHTEEYTNFEKVMYIYDLLKMYNIDEKSKKDYITQIEEKCSNIMDINTIFSYILDEVGIKNFVGSIKSEDKKYSIILVEIMDLKYNLNGLYLFNVVFDNLPKEEYKNEDVRRVNYNFFGLKVEDYDYSINYDTLTGILSYFSNSNYEYSFEKVKFIKDKETNNSLKKMMNQFNDSFEGIYKKLWDIRDITFDDIERSREVLYKDSKEYNDMVKENYNLRREELFRPKIDEIINKIRK